MVKSINLIFITISAGVFVFVPLIPFVIMIIKKRTKAMLLGMAGFSIYGIILKNLVFFLIFLIPYIKDSLSINIVIYSLSIGVISACLHLLVRYILSKKQDIADTIAFSTGESFIQCIYVGVPVAVLNLVYALIVNFGGFEYIGMTDKLMPVLTSLINADYTESLPNIAYPFWVFAVNWLTLSIFNNNKLLSALTEFALITIYSFLSMQKLFLLNTAYMFFLVILTVFILIIFNTKKRRGIHVENLKLH